MLSRIALRLGFGAVAAVGHYPNIRGVISLLEKQPERPVQYPYLIYSDKKQTSVDLITLCSFAHSRDLSNFRSLSGMGLEIRIKDCRGDAELVANWLMSARKLARFCRLSHCQFIISSGAESIRELVPGPSLDAILRLCGVDPATHWRELNQWLESRTLGRVML